MNNKFLAMVYAGIILVSYISGFLTIQVNTMSKCLNDLFGINQLLIGIVVAVLAGITIFGGVKKIAHTTGKLVPAMAIFYLTSCIFIILVNIKMVPGIIVNIFNSAFNFKTFGVGILSTLIIGMQKGIFSSEVGLGTGSIAAVTADTKSPSQSGLVQTFGIHIENLVIATITTFVICMSDYQTMFFSEPNGIEISLYAFQHHIGNFGSIIVAITITLFALSTVLTGYYYGESSLKFIKKTNLFDTFILKIITLIVLVVGSVASSETIWTIIDFMVGVMAIINVYALFKLRKMVTNE